MLSYSSPTRYSNHDILLQFTVNYQRHDPSIKQKILFTGNNLKSMRNSVDDSLKRLRTNYIDILYIHWWDYTCGVEEIMNGLHQLVLEGKVLYLVSWLCEYASVRHASPLMLSPIGCIRYSSMVCRESKSIRQRPWQVALRNLSRKMERFIARF